MFFQVNYTGVVDSGAPLPFLIDVSNDIPRFRAETFWTKEPETIEWIKNYSNVDSRVGLFIDVGANIGIYALFASMLCNSLDVIAVEPVLQNFSELTTNVLRNNRTMQINTVNVALSNKSGQGQLLNNDGRIGSSGAQIQISDEVVSGGTTVKTGDDLINEIHPSFCISQKLVMIKIDTDGNELDVLRGFNCSFDKQIIATVLVETHPSNKDGIEEFLVSKGFCEDKSYLLLPGHSNERRIQKGNSERTIIYSR